MYRGFFFISSWFTKKLQMQISIRKLLFVCILQNVGALSLLGDSMRHASLAFSFNRHSAACMAVDLQLL